MGSVTVNYRSIRGSIRRILRNTAYRAIELGLLQSIARALAIVDARRSLYLLGRTLAIAARRSDHTDFWRTASHKFPSDATFVRQTIHFALRAGRQSVAEEGMQWLIANLRARARDCDLVIGLSYLHQQLGDSAAVRELVRGFLKSLPDQKERRVSGLRLSRILLLNFARKHFADPNMERERSHRQLNRMVERASLPVAPRMLLERVIRCEGDLAEISPSLLLDTDVSRAQCRAFVQMVIGALRAGRGFSFVRLGDGEAACLPYEPELAWLAKGDAIEREKIWWGAPLTRDQRRRMTRLVFNATWNADCIGIPAASRFLRETRMSENDGLDRGLTGRGLRAILYSTEHCRVFRGSPAPPPTFASCHLHQDIERWALYDELFQGADEIVFVSCHPGLADYARQRFGARIATSIVLPPDRVSAPALKVAPTERRRLPDMLDEVALKVAEASRQRLVLVGAGYLGKWLVDVARTRGGVALDLGSVFDYWLGLATRSYLDLNPVK